jgi:hypothetical protein
LNTGSVQVAVLIPIHRSGTEIGAVPIRIKDTGTNVTQAGVPIPTVLLSGRRRENPGAW